MFLFPFFAYVDVTSIFFLMHLNLQYLLLSSFYVSCTIFMLTQQHTEDNSL